jgi:hypothetical protein
VILGTVFVNSVANVVATKAQLATLSLVPKGGATFAGPVVGRCFGLRIGLRNSFFFTGCIAYLCRVHPRYCARDCRYAVISMLSRLSLFCHGVPVPLSLCLNAVLCWANCWCSPSHVCSYASGCVVDLVEVTHLHTLLCCRHLSFAHRFPLFCTPLHARHLPISHTAPGHDSSSTDESWGRLVTIGPLQFGQPRQFVVPMNIPLRAAAATASFLDVTLTYTAITAGQGGGSGTGGEQQSVCAATEASFGAAEWHAMARADAVQTGYAAVAAAADGKGRPAQARVDELGNRVRSPCPSPHPLYFSPPVWPLSRTLLSSNTQHCNTLSSNTQHCLAPNTVLHPTLSNIPHCLAPSTVLHPTLSCTQHCLALSSN